MSISDKPGIRIGLVYFNQQLAESCLFVFSYFVDQLLAGWIFFRPLVIAAIGAVMFLVAIHL